MSRLYPFLKIVLLGYKFGLYEHPLLQLAFEIADSEFLARNQETFLRDGLHRASRVATIYE